LREISIFASISISIFAEGQIFVFLEINIRK